MIQIYLWTLFDSDRLKICPNLEWLKICDLMKMYESENEWETFWYFPVIDWFIDC